MLYFDVHVLTFNSVFTFLLKFLDLIHEHLHFEWSRGLSTRGYNLCHSKGFSNRLKGYAYGRKLEEDYDLNYEDYEFKYLIFYIWTIWPNFIPIGMAGSRPDENFDFLFKIVLIGKWGIIWFYHSNYSNNTIFISHYMQMSWLCFPRKPENVMQGRHQTKYLLC